MLDGRAKRHGAIVCARLRALVRSDGLHQQVSVRFLAGLEPALRDELEQLRNARGSSGARLVERLAPIDLELRSPRGDHQLTGCRLGPPIARFAPLEQIDFRLRST